MKELSNLKVKVKLQNKVMSSTQLETGRQELTLSSGEKLVTDLYLPLFGLTPNTSYVPENFLNSQGYVMADEYLRVKGTEAAWAIGDVSDVEFSQIMSCDRQSVHLAKTITALLSSKSPVPYKASTTSMILFSILWEI
jgi:NADH dehydrogenase FAD-containing subunit